MTLKDKRRFIREVMDGARKDLLGAVDKVPEGWDGHELRRWICDRMRSRYDYVDLTPRDVHDYNNECMVRNLL